MTKFVNLEEKYNISLDNIKFDKKLMMQVFNEFTVSSVINSVKYSVPVNVVLNTYVAKLIANVMSNVGIDVQYSKRTLNLITAFPNTKALEDYLDSLILHIAFDSRCSTDVIASTIVPLYEWYYSGSFLNFALASNLTKYVPDPVILMTDDSISVIRYFNELTYLLLSGAMQTQLYKFDLDTIAQKVLVQHVTTEQSSNELALA